MTTKIVCRLLDAENRLLGWVEHYARARGDGCLRADGPVVIPIKVPGVPAIVSLHWCDVNVEVRVPAPVRGGLLLLVFEHDAPMIRVGAMPAGLPAVTVGRPVAIGIPVGQMGARG